MHLGVDRAPEMHISSDLLHADAKQRTLALKAVTKINRKLNFDTVDLIKRETSFLKIQGEVNVRQNLRYSIDLIPSCHTMFGYFTEFLQSFNWYKHVTLINHYQSIRSIDFVSYFHFVIQRVSKIKLMLPTHDTKLHIT